MSFAQHFAQHISALHKRYRDALTLHNDYEAILLHSGSEQFYFADDQSPVFRATPHFTHWLPVQRPDQCLLIIPGEKAIYWQVIPVDFWHEQDIELADWVQEQFLIHRLEKPMQIEEHLRKMRSVTPNRLAFIGENTAFATALGIPREAQNPQPLLHYLDFHRAVKSEYEIACIRKANRLALQGHTAARHAFADGASEYEIHMAYLHACAILDTETPYTNIVALDEKSAILHYQNKRRSSGLDSQVLLIDAGCRVHGYCSDITRTSTKSHTLPLFCDLVEAIEALQNHLVRQLRSGVDYPEIHHAAHIGLSNILVGSGICRGKAEDLLAHKVSTLFMPHGVGHLLGLQVHDVGGRMKNEHGEMLAPPQDYPTLRTTRKIEPGQVFTIEPGLYFIPMLLDKERGTERGQLIDWDLVDTLMPLGGIRIEDNVLVTESGVENLTRVLI